MTNGGMSQGGSQGGFGAGGGGGKQIPETITPVTIKQIHEAGTEPGGDKLQVNGASIEQITCVARITQAKVEITMIAFNMDDCTGIIEGSHILPADEASGGHEFAVQKRERLKEGAWVRVVGIVDENISSDGVNSGRKMTIYKIRAIDDYNEILYHRVDVVKTFLSLTRPKTSAAANGMSNAATGTDVKNVGGTGFTAVPGGGIPTTGEDGLTMTPLQREILEYVKSRVDANSGNGVPISDIQKDISAKAPIEVVREIMEGFATDGHVYTSIDENHFVYCQQ